MRKVLLNPDDLQVVTFFTTGASTNAHAGTVHAHTGIVTGACCQQSPDTGTTDPDSTGACWTDGGDTCAASCASCALCDPLYTHPYHPTVCDHGTC